jgi:hypothetical protein
MLDRQSAAVSQRALSGQGSQEAIDRDFGRSEEGVRSISKEEVMRICAIEAHYWGEVDDDRICQFMFGAMGAASNILSAIMRELTPEQFEEEVKARNAQIEAHSNSPKGQVI